MSHSPELTRDEIAALLYDLEHKQGTALYRMQIRVKLMEAGILRDEEPPQSKRQRKPNPPVQGNPTRAAEERIREEARYKRRVKSRCLADVESEEYEWLWQGRIPLRTISLIAGDGGAGKSTLTGMLAATVTTGGCWPDRPDEPVETGRVVILSAEENAATDIRPRYDRFGADTRMVHILDAIDAGPDVEEQFSLARDIPVLTDFVRELGDVRLVMIDPIGAYLHGADSHKDDEVQRLLTPLVKLADELELAIVMVAHLTKQMSASIQARIQGAAAFVNKSRMVWFFSPDPRDPRRRLMSLIKKNPDDAVMTGLAVGYTGGRLCWDPEPVPMSAEEVNRRLFKLLTEGDGKPGPKDDKGARVRRMIEARLEGGIWVDLPDIESEAKDEYKASRGTVHRVLKRMNGSIQMRDTGDGHTKQLRLRPDLGIYDAQSAHAEGDE